MINRHPISTIYEYNLSGVFLTAMSADIRLLQDRVRSGWETWYPAEEIRELIRTLISQQNAIEMARLDCRKRHPDMFDAMTEDGT